MEVEVHLDHASVHRYHRRVLVFLMAIALPLTSYLVRPIVAVMLGGEAGEWSAFAMILIGFVTALSSPLWCSWDMLVYRCPRCRRRLSRVSPEGVAEANIHYCCEDCHVIWDLGWAWHGGGEGGG